jgi:hypothetical protein
MDVARDRDQWRDIALHVLKFHVVVVVLPES